MAERLTIQFNAKGAGALKKTLQELHLANVKLIKGQAAFVKSQKQVTKENEKLQKGLFDTQRGTRNTTAKFSVLRSKMLLAAFAVTTLTHTFRRFTQASAEATEGLNKANVVFGESMGIVKEWSDALGGAIGRSSDKIVMMASTFQDTLVPMGATRESAATLSTQMTELALDVASFNNKMDADVIRDFQSAMVGNHETVRKYGIVITQAALKQQAYEMSLFSGKGELSEHAKIQARVALLFKGTTDAQGDLMRTQQDYTNLVKKLNDQLFDSYKIIGDILTKFVLPPIIKLATLLAQPKHILATAGAFAVMGTRMLLASKAMVALKTAIKGYAIIAASARSTTIKLRVALSKLTKTMHKSTLGLSLLVAAFIEFGFWMFGSKEKTEDFEAELEKLKEELGEATLEFDDVADSIKETDDALESLNKSIEESIKNLRTDIQLLQTDNPLLKEAIQITRSREGGLSSLTDTESRLLAIKHEQIILNDTLNKQESEGLEFLSEKNKAKIEELKNSEDFLKAQKNLRESQREETKVSKELAAFIETVGTKVWDDTRGMVEVTNEALQDYIKTVLEAQDETADATNKVEEFNKKLHDLKVSLTTSQVAMSSLLGVSDSLKSSFKFLSFDLALLAETFTETFEILREEGFTAAEAYEIAWTQAAGTVASALIESQLSITGNQISEARKRARSELEHLRQTRSYQKASDREKKKLEEAATKASVDEMKKAFKRKQQLAATGVIIDTASAVMGIWKDVPKGDFGFAAGALMALVTALGASQLELINSQQPPKMAQGGYIGGRRHSQGGTLIEAEQGEFIMNRDAVSTLGIETMNRINRGQGGSLVNVSFNGNVMSDDFIQEEAIPKIKEAIRRGADIGIG